MINSCILILSLMLINITAAVRIIEIFVLKESSEQFIHRACVVSGLYMLFFGQLFTYIHKMVQDNDLLILIVGSFFSFALTIILLMIDYYNDWKSRRTLIITMPKNIVYYEGTSGLGKTTMSTDHSYDFTNYTHKYPLYKSKQALPYVQTMYMMQVYSDIIMDLLEFSKDDAATTSINDRHIFSQLVYDIVFFYQGERTNPPEFRQMVNRAIFENRSCVKLLKISMRRVFNTVKSIAPNTNIKIDWFVSADALFTKQRLIDRGGFEAYKNNWNLEWYVHNQNYIFRKLWEISGIGDMHVVKLI